MNASNTHYPKNQSIREYLRPPFWHNFLLTYPIHRHDRLFCRRPSSMLRFIGCCAGCVRTYGDHSSIRASFSSQRTIICTTAYGQFLAMVTRRWKPNGPGASQIPSRRFASGRSIPGRRYSTAEGGFLEYSRPGGESPIAYSAYEVLRTHHWIDQNRVVFEINFKVY